MATTDHQKCLTKQCVKCFVKCSVVHLCCVATIDCAQQTGRHVLVRGDTNIHARMLIELIKPCRLL